MEYMFRNVNGDHIVQLSSKEMKERFPNWVYDNCENYKEQDDYLLPQQEKKDKDKIVNFRHCTRKTNMPNRIREKKFVVEKQLFQGVIHQMLHNDDTVIFCDDKYSSQEFQNIAIDC